MSRAYLALLLAAMLIALMAYGRATGAEATPSVTSATPPEPTTARQPAPPPIITPRPMQAEEPLTGANSSVPSIFAGVTSYTPVEAALTVADANEWTAATIADAARAVVQIRRCDAFGCDAPVGSGVIIHPSGLILTAFHVLLSDPNDPNASRYADFVIATTESIRNPPEPRFRAHVVATKDEQDLALLAIDRDQDDQAIAAQTLQLPVLPLADVNSLFGEELYVLGFPVSGGEAVSYDRVNFRSFDDGGRIIVVNQPLDRGNSGGPALVVRNGQFAIAGLVIRRRSSQDQLSPQGLLRAIDQLHTLAWTPTVPRAWAEDVRASSDGNLLQFTLRLNALDLADEPLRLFFYATDGASGQPWQPAAFTAPLVVWANVPAQQVFVRQALTLSVPLSELGAQPDQLRFHPLLWDVALGDKRWEALAEGVQAVPGAVAMAVATPATGPSTAVGATTPPPTQMPTATATATHTDTPAPTATSTTDLLATQTVEAAQFATALAATLAARFTPTLTSTATPDFDQRLATAVAATLAAQVTPTPTATATATPANTATPTNTATASATPTLAPGATRVVTLAPGVDTVFVYVPAGPFTMGSLEGEGGDDEHPQHEVTLDAFWIMQTEVTNAQYGAFVDADGYTTESLWTTEGWQWRTANNITQPEYWDDATWNKPDYPVVGVNWYESAAFANWLADETGLPIRLPTEAEWEKAARGADGRSYPWGNETPSDQLLNYNKHVGSTSAVGSYPGGASPYGTLDMAGNVWEWVADRYDAGYYAISPIINPSGPTTGDDRVVRGGSWNFASNAERSAFRFRYHAINRYRVLGLRLVWSPGF